jgi:hypothetical protein
MTIWARSLANLSSAKAISSDDEDKSFNNAWKDLYARLLESNDDYFTTTLVIPIIPSMLSGTNEWLVPLPENFYQLRTAEYQSGVTSGQWMPLEKFALSSRTDEGRNAGYRLDNNNLWVKGQGVSSVRVKYYPPPALLTHPQPDLQYATAVTPNNFSLITSPVYAAWKNTGVYIYNAQNIVEGSIDDNTTGTPVTLLAAGANLSNLAYYKGYLYWLQAGNIKRAPTDLVTTPLVSANVIATGAVTSFGVFKDKLYYNDGGTMKSANVDGTGVAALLALPGSWLSLAGGVVFYIDATANLKAIGGGTLVAGTAVACTSDGTNLYMLDTAQQLHLLRVSGAALYSDTILRTDVTAIGPWAASRIPLITGEVQTFVAFSAIIDSDITYPLNVVLEIMAYQAAIDFKTKIGEDFSQLMERLGHPKGGQGVAVGLWARMEGVVKRDEYKPEKVNNSRRIAGNW